jgi:hypothetical protein
MTGDLDMVTIQLFLIPGHSINPYNAVPQPS